MLDSTFWCFDCDCFIQSMQSSMVPFGCASCHLNTRSFHSPIRGPPDLTCITPIMALPLSNGFHSHTPSRPEVL
uniref:Uncharacterized protein n=1 Tax=Arundo donax TaxID=35708 RepID=A0A0A9BBQ3_ARUDO